MMTLPGRQHLDRTHAVPSTAYSTILAYGVLFLLFVYYMLNYLDFPVLSISELFWNALVYLTPTAVISFLHPSANLTTQKDEGNKSFFRSVGYARKSEALRHILGLDGTGVMSNVQRARSVSGIGTMMKGIPSSAPPGLGNWDNSCYQNSILQGLAALQSLSSYLVRNTRTEGMDSTKAALRGLLARLNDPANAGKMFWTPAVLKSMSSWQQQDAQEYFSKVIDEVDKEVSEAVELKPQNMGLAALVNLDLSSSNPKHETSPEVAEASLDTTRPHELPDELASIIARNPLEGLLAQRVGCLRCGYVEGLSLIPFNCLTVPLGRQWMYDIRSCLDEYTGLESINGVECAKCTLLHTKQQLERLLSQIQAQSSGDDDVATSGMLKALKDSSLERLAAVDVALEEADFSDNTLLKKCQINANSKVSTTKSRQAVVARAPKSLAIHVNRSVFDEITGAQTKNFADVRFPYRFDLGSWCLGGGVSSSNQEVEEWNTDPALSMLSSEIEEVPLHLQKVYELRAVVTHYGRHENGHYICYRKYPLPRTSDIASTDQPAERWWRLSDDEVSQVSQDNVLSQGGVFMLFYEQVQQKLAPPNTEKGEVRVQEQKASDSAPGIDESPLVEVPFLAKAGEDEKARVLLASEIARVSQILDTVNPSAVQGHTTTEAVEGPSQALNEGRPITTDIIRSPTKGDNPLHVEQGANAIQPLASAQTSSTCKTIIENLQPSAASALGSSEPDVSPPEANCLPPASETPIIESWQTAPTMRTAPPRSGRGSVSRGKGMGQVSSMVTAN